MHVQPKSKPIHTFKTQLTTVLGIQQTNKLSLPMQYKSENCFKNQVNDYFQKRISP